MRLNKKKLAALAMSAVMAASTMPFPVLAEEFTDGDGTIVAAYEAAGPDYAAASVVFDGDTPQIKVPVKNADGDTIDTKTAENVEVYTATNVPNTDGFDCTKDTEIMYKGQLDGTDVYASCVTRAAAKSHDYKATSDYKVKTLPTHSVAGVGYVVYQCATDGCTSTTVYEDADHEVEIPATGHTWSDELKYKLPDGCNVQIGTDGPELINETIDGYYYAYYLCVDSDKEVKNGDTTGIKWLNDGKAIKILATAPEVNSFDITKTEGIQTSTSKLETLLELKNGKVVIKEGKLGEIELKDCAVEGSITVQYTMSNGSKSTAVVLVEPHHYNEEKVAVFKTSKDRELCTVTKDLKTGELIVTSNSCTAYVEYEEVTLCHTSQKCSEKSIAVVAKDKYIKTADDALTATGYVVTSETKTAEPALKHTAKAAAKTEVANLVKTGNVKYSALKNIANTYKGYMTISERTSCDTEEEITVSYICTMDRKNVAEEETVTVIPEKHIVADVAEDDESTYVPATCAATGSKEVVTKCTLCGKELSRNTVVIPRLKHTNEKSVGVSSPSNSGAYLKDSGKVVVDFNGDMLKYKKAGDTLSATLGLSGIGYGVSIAAYTNCTECGQHEVKVGVPVVKLVAIEGQNEAGEAGFITVEVSYTKTGKLEEGEEKVITAEYTYDYFTNLIAYMDRTETEPFTGFEADENGAYRYYVNDEFQKDANGIVEINGKEYLVKDGIWSNDQMGVTLVGDKFYFLSYGIVQRGFSGINTYDGQAFYLNNGEVDTTINGLVPFNGGTFLFAAGRFVKEHNGLWQDFDGTWYFLAVGQVQAQHTGVAEYNGSYFYVKDGKLDTTKNGTITVDGVKYNAVNGQLYVL